ncbi:MAG: ribosome recycling factor [Bacilli bacterium]|nr:ribosome recycling factor [Bacilli bacterium]
MEEIIEITKQDMQNAIESMQKRFANIRAGRANVSILDNIVVNYYGSDTPLRQIANVYVPEARQIAIKPYDKSALAGIEKAIYESNLGLTPNNNGELIILAFPPLTEERRKEFVKDVKGIAEETRVSLRNIRQDSNNAIRDLKLPEDEEKRGVERIQLVVNDYNKKIDDLLKEKEVELMTI